MADAQHQYNDDVMATILAYQGNDTDRTGEDDVRFSYQNFVPQRLFLYNPNLVVFQDVNTTSTIDFALEIDYGDPHELPILYRSHCGKPSRFSVDRFLQCV